MKAIKLSVVICSLHARHRTLRELLDGLQRQARLDEVEILIATDMGQIFVGDKRNALVARAAGEYVVHIDDDDLVAPDYLGCILQALDQQPGVDVVLIRGRRTEGGQRGGQHVIEFDYRLHGVEGERVDGVLWRSPGHLCPIRTVLARQQRFPSQSYGEDLIWSQALASRLRTGVRAGAPGQVLYHYRWRHADLDAAVPTVGRVGAVAAPARRPGQQGQAEESDSLHRTSTVQGKAEREAHGNPYRVREREPGRVAGGDAWKMGMITESDHTAIFTPQYTQRSGPGSTPTFSAPYRQFLEDFLRQHQIKSVLDLGCGDLEVMSRVRLGGVTYLGLDCIGARIQANARAHPQLRFQCADFRTVVLPYSDLVLCKDVLQHWATSEILAWLTTLRQAGNYRFALLTNCNYGETVNQELVTGGWRALDLTKSPFSLGEVCFRWNNKDVVLLRGPPTTRLLLDQLPAY